VFPQNISPSVNCQAAECHSLIVLASHGFALTVPGFFADKVNHSQ
jgi:hypothetical protein